MIRAALYLGALRYIASGNVRSPSGIERGWCPRFSGSRTRERAAMARLTWLCGPGGSCLRNKLFASPNSTADPSGGSFSPPMDG